MEEAIAQKCSAKDFSLEGLSGPLERNISMKIRA